MNAAEADPVGKPGEVYWKLDVPGIPYDAYAFSQALIFKPLMHGWNGKTFLILLLVGIAIGAGAVFLELSVTVFYEIGRYDYSGYGDGVDLVISHYLAAIAALLGFYFVSRSHRAALFRKFYQAAGVGTQDMTLSIGDNGVLIVADNVRHFIPWERVSQVAENGWGFFLLTRSCYCLTVPASTLERVPDREALLSFIRGKVQP